MKTQDTYGEPTIMHFPNMTVRVCHPILTEEEYQRRMEIIHDAAADLLISAERMKERLGEQEECFEKRY